MNGDVNLTNMKLKSTLFDSMPLPFALAYGQIGTMHFKIPVWNMFNQPLVIEITDLFALVRPKHIKEWNEEVEVKAYQNASQSRLEQYEVFSQSAESLIQKDPSSVEKLVAKIIDNIQIKIKNIYVRYEDTISAERQGTGKFVMGILLKEFSTFTTGEDWKTKIMTLGEELTHKLAKIKNFSLFLDYESDQNQQLALGQKLSYPEMTISLEKLQNDESNTYFKEILRNEFEGTNNNLHHYLIDKFGMEARLTLNKNPLTNQRPQLEVDLLFGGHFKDQNGAIDLGEKKAPICVALNVHQPQIIRILKLLEYIGYYNQFQSGALTKFQRRAIKQNQADSYIREYCEWRIIKDSKKKEEISRLRKSIKEIEDQYPAQKIIVLRKFANKLIEQKLEQQKTEEEISKKVQEMSKEKIGWGLFISRDRKAQEQKAIEEFKDKMEKELKERLTHQKDQLDTELNSLTEELSKQQLITNEEDFSKMPQGYLRFKIRISVPSLRFIFINEFEQCLFVAEIKDQLATVNLGRGFTKACFQVCSLNMSDCWTGTKAFPNILETQEVVAATQEVSGDQAKQAFIFIFESNDQMVISPFRIEIDTQKTLFIVANFPFIKEIKRSMLSALQGEQLDFTFFREAATEKALAYMSQGKEFIESLKTGDYMHKSLDITMFLSAPVFLIPENIFDPSRPCLIIDTGSISLKSEIVAYDQSIDYAMISSPQAVYDRYDTTLSNFQINILENGLPLGLKSFQRGMGSPAIKEFTAKLTIFNCLEPMHPLFPTAEIAIVIKNFEVHFGIKFIEGLMRIKNSILESFDTTDDLAFQNVQISKAIKSDLISSKTFENKKDTFDSSKITSSATDDEEQFYDMIEEDLDTSKKDNVIQKQAKDRNLGLTTSVKVYFSVEKLQILLQQDVSRVENERVEIQREDIINIVMLHFGIEVEVDRKTDTHVQLSIFKFVIEDIQKGIHIAPAFRMILSSPEVDKQRASPNKEREGSFHFATFQDIALMDTYTGGVIQRSLVTLLKKSEEDDDFKDAIDSEEDREKSLMNEFDLSVHIKEQTNIKVECTLADMRFVFAVPTAQKLVDVGLALQTVFEEVEKDRVREKQVKLQNYKTVLENLCLEDQSSKLDDKLLIKIFRNMALSSGLSIEAGQVIYLQALKKLQKEILQQQQSLVKEIEQSIEVEISPIKESQLDLGLSKISIKAKLMNFSVWIPLQAQSHDSQIFNLSFMSSLTFDKETQINILTKDSLDFQISNFVISMINFNEFLESQKHSQKSIQTQNTISRMLDPFKISLLLNQSSTAIQSSMDLSVAIDPLNMRIGFKHIDFANVVMAQVTGTLQYIQRLQTKTQIISESTNKNMSPIKKRSLQDNQEEEKSIQNEEPAQKVKSAVSVQTKKVVSSSSIKVICKILTLSLSDDTDPQRDRPLFSAKLQNMQLIMKSFEKEDDPATFILKKMGIWQKRHPKEAKDQQFKDIQAFSEILMNYYNHRSLAYEPLLEPWYIQLSMNQLASYTQQMISIESKRMLNLNMTFGMALTVKKIKDRVLESLKQAQIMSKLDEGYKPTKEESDSQKVWQQQFTSSHLQLTSQEDFDQDTGFIFQNFTGQDLRLAIHDDGRIFDATKQKQTQFQLTDQEWRLDGKDAKFIVKKSSNELSQLRSYQHKNAEMEEEPLTLDLKLHGLNVLENVQIEGLGVYSYRAHMSYQSNLSLGENKEEVKSSQFFKGIFGADEDKPKPELDQRIGIIVNVKMEGCHKRVTIESQLVIANNLKDQDIKVYVKNDNQDDYQVRSDQKATIHAGQTLRVPLSWLHGLYPNSLFVETSKKRQLLFKNLNELFTDKAQNSKLTKKHTQVVELSPNFHSSVDLFSYKCLPKSADDGMPPQYIVSFNAPMIVSNYNFQPMEVRYPQFAGLKPLSQIAPKETAFLYSLDCINAQPNLEWLIYENTSKSHLSLITNAFDINRRLGQQPQLETFMYPTQNKGNKVGLRMEVKKVLHQTILSYEGENFELRERLFDHVSSCQIMFYPAYMIVNKTSMPFICESQQFMPLSNDYLNTTKDHVNMKVPGYSQQEVDITTIGVSGALCLELDNKDQVQIDKLSHQEYIPQKIEFGIIISFAPTPFNKTTVITIVPRYLVLNQLGAPIVLKQKNSGFPMKQVLLDGQQCSFNFQSKKDRFVMIRQVHQDENARIARGGKLFDDLVNDEQFWSSPFSIDDIEDFQVGYPMNVLSQDSTQQWYMPNDSNGFMRFVRVIVTTQNDASILIVITNPVYPEYEIQNKTNSDIEIAQLQDDSSLMSGLTKMMTNYDDMIYGKFRRIKQKATIPYAWQYRLNKTRQLVIKIGTSIHNINVDKALQKVEVQGLNGKRFQIEIRVCGNAKRVRITEVGSTTKESKAQALYLQNLIKKTQGQQLSVKIDIRGLSLSFIDEQPQELLLLTLYGLKVRLQKWFESREDRSGFFETITKLKFQMQHLQLDNMTNQIMPVILAPTRQLLNKQDYLESSLLQMKTTSPAYQQEENKKKDESPPFIQFIVNIAESQGENDKIAVKRLRALQFAIQEFSFQCETSIINSNLKFVIELLATFNENQGINYLIAKSESFDHAKNLKREEICDYLDPFKALIDQSEDIHAKKMFVELIHLGAIKANITFRLEKMAVELDVSDPARGFGILNLLYTLLSGVASISNSPLTFKELMLLDVFASQDVLIRTITKNYTRQGLLQFYKLLGSSDIIGNPVGLIDKLGTGAYEFIAEPTKGLLRGPDEFVGGIGKGVQSLVTNVVSGGFESLSKITGSLYSVVKNVSGEKNAQIQKSEHIGQGLLHGVTGGVSELVGGVTGIFTKPIQKTKEEGAKGFFKGLGSGLMGAISAPVTATLRAGSSITQGVAATATQIGNIGKTNVTVDANSLYSRFRPPRYFNSRNVLTVYDLDLALINQILATCSNGKYASNQSIRQFATMQETSSNGELQNRDPNSSILIITDKMLLYLRIDREGSTRGKPHLIFKMKLRKLIRLEISQSGNAKFGFIYTMQIAGYSQASGMQKYQFQSNDRTKFEKVYNLLSVIPHCDASDKIRGLENRAQHNISQQ